MCGRYEMHHEADELIERFFLAEISDQYYGNYNIAPSQQVPVIVQHGEHRVLETMKWGLIPSWSKDAKIAYKMINARCEGIETKPAFRDAIKQRRCLIPIDGFYEWQQVGKTKTPFHISVQDEDVFALAGIWEEWKNPNSGQLAHNFAIITTEANEQMSEIHHRMPAILEPDQESLWLDRSTPLSEVLDVLKPYSGGLKIYPVSTAINSARNQGVGVIEKVVSNDLDTNAQLALF